MNEFTLSELGLFIGTIGGVVTTLIFAVQKSKCDTINCCGIKCHRKLVEPPDNAQEQADPAPVERPVNPALIVPPNP